MMRSDLWHFLIATAEWRQLEELLLDEISPLRVTSYQWDVMHRVNIWLGRLAPELVVTTDQWAQLRGMLEDERQPVRAHAAFEDTMPKIESWLHTITHTEEGGTL